MFQRPVAQQKYLYIYQSEKLGGENQMVLESFFLSSYLHFWGLTSRTGLIVMKWKMLRALKVIQNSQAAQKSSLCLSVLCLFP